MSNRDFAADVRPARIYREAWADVLDLLWTLAAFLAFFAVLAAVVFAPAGTWISRRLISSTGRLAAGNNEIIAFLFSPMGVLAVLVALAFATAVAAVEFGGMTRLAWWNYQGIRVDAARGLIGASRRFPNALALGFLQGVAHLIIAVPMVGLGALVYDRLLSDYDIYYLVNETPPVWWTAVGIVGFLGLTALVLHGAVYLRLSLAIPAVMVEPIGPLEAVRMSNRLVRGLGWRKAVLLLLLPLLLTLLPLAIPPLTDLLGTLVFRVVPSTPAAGVPVVILFMALVLAATLVLGFLILAYLGMLLARTYRSLRPEAVQERPDEAPPREHALRGRGVWVMWGVLLAGLIGYTTWTLFTLELGDRVDITAHRGSVHDAPENTLRAIEQAILDGADYAEIDVQETADGILVLFHDEDFRRMKGDPRNIWDMTWEEVRQQDVGSWFGEAFAGERVPTLEQAIETARGRIRLNVELKVTRHEKQLPEKVAATLREKDFVAEAIVTSLDYGALQRVRKTDPEIRTGFTIFESIGDLTRSDVDILLFSARSATPLRIVTAQRAGMEVHVWTINTRDRMAWFLDLGVDNVITDRPAELSALLQEREEMDDWELLFLKVRNWLRQ